MVLDEQDGEPELVADPPDGLAELVDLAVGQARGRLVEQQEPGLGGQRPRQLQALERAERQARGGAEGVLGETELSRSS